MRLYDQAGNAVDVPDEQATQALASGRYGLPAGSTVPLVTDDGIRHVDVADVAHHVAQGATVATAQDLASEKYGGIAGGLEAAGEGALSGATLGLSDVAASAVGGEAVRQRLADVRAAHPYVHGAAELAGTLAPALLTGGASEGASAAELGGRAVADAAEHAGGVGGLLRGAGRVLSAPVEATTRVGSLFDRGVGGLVGDEATSLAGRIAQGGAKLAGRGAAEGAIYGGAQELDEQALGPAPLNGEKLLAAIGHGALLGSLGGAGLGAAGALGSEVLGRTAARLGGVAEERAAKSVISGAGQLRSVKDMGRVPGGVRAVGRELLDRDLVRAGDTIDDIAPRLSAERSKVGNELATMRGAADAAGVEGPSVWGVAKGLQSHLEEMAALPTFNSGAMDRVQSLVADLSAAADPSTGRLGFAQAAKLRGRIDQAINYSRTPGVANATEDALKAVRGALEEETERAGEAIGNRLGTDWAKDYRSAKVAYRKLAVADDAASRAVASRQANRVISPTDYLSGIGGAAIGLGHGAVTGGISALALGVAHHYLRERGASTAAVYLDRVAKLGAVQRAAASVDRAVAAGADRLAGRAGAAAPRSLPEAAEGYQAKRAAVAAAAADPAAHQEAVQRAAQPLSVHAPLTSAALRSAAVRATSYLVAQLPPHPAPRSLLPQARDAEHEPPGPVQAAFIRKVDAVHDPVSLLTHAHDGTLTRDQVDAVQATHPELLAEMRSRTLAALADRDPSQVMPLDRKQALSTLLGQPVDATVAPAFSAALQGAYAALPKGQPAPPNKPGGKHGAPKREIETKGVGLGGESP